MIVRNSVEFQRAEVELARLSDDGSVPLVAVWVGAESDGRALLDTVLEARAVQYAANLTGTDARSVDTALSTWARLLAEHAADFLAGSDECIEEAHRLVLARVRRHPQVLTINLPRDATQEQEAAAVSEARAHTPEYVEIRVQRYDSDRRRRRGK